MSITVPNAMMFSSVLSAALMAGLLYGWVVSVIPGLSRVSDRTYVSTMQTINRAIINPGFVVPFMIPPLVLGAGAVVFWRSGQNRRALWLAVAAVTYLLGVLGVTFGGNIPLNNALDQFDLESATEQALARQRADYEGPWNRWHALRTGASVLTLACAAVAAISDEQ